MGRAGLSDDEQRAVASGNCLRLLGVGESSIGLRAAAAAVNL
jgi:hypothetical protein